MADVLAGAKAAEATSKVAVHPLVLLTASDLLTRHRLRGLEGPVIGLLLGQQRGTEITAEHAFTAKLHEGLLDHRENWTSKRIDQYKDVHKNPALDVVGWFALCPEEGPLPEHSLLHKQIRSLYAENAIFVAIHPASFNTIEGTKGTLPISVFESSETDLVPNDGKMQVDGAEDLKFQPVPYTIETDETEMIAINYVAKGAGSAAAVNGVAQTSGSSTKDSANIGKSRAISKADNENADEKPEAPQTSRVLTADEEDQVAGITTRVNSVKMLQSRIQLLSSLVASTPPSYLNDTSTPMSENSPPSSHVQQLRNIQALITRLALLTPGSAAGLQSLSQASQAQSNDIALTELLATLGQETQALSELGKKYVAAEIVRVPRNKNKAGYGTGPFGGLDDHDGPPGFPRNANVLL